jgi:hypothetical protein
MRYINEVLNTIKTSDRKTVLRMAAYILLPTVLFVYIFSADMGISLNDPDVWWHLKTGDYILENWEVPDVDPFAYTTPRPLSQSQKIGLRSQWLGQVIFNLSERMGGMMGIGILRNLLIIMPGIVLYIWLARRGIGPLTAITVTSIPAFFLGMELFYAFERPQGLSFFIVLMIIITLERLRRKCTSPGKDISFILLPLLTALWSNIHAGFIVGNMIIIIYAVSEFLRFGYNKARRTDEPTMRPSFYIICAVAILTSFLNPNTYHVFYSYASGLFSMFMKDLQRTMGGGSGSWVREVVLEYKPLYYFYKHLEYYWLLFYWAFTVLLYASMILKYILRRRFDLAEFISVSLVVAFANMYARGIMFSLTVMPLYMGKTILELRPPEIRFRHLSKAVAAAVLAVTIGFCTYSYTKNPKLFKPRLTKNWVTPWYPTHLSSFILANPIAPPMYNYYTWGGYLIWRTYPKYQVFIDGRAIDDWINRTADSILKTQPGWMSQLEAYNINFVVIPTIFRESGHIIPLAVALVYEEEWKLVFIANNSAVFVKDKPINRDIIFKYNVDKKNVFREIIKVENLLLMGSPNNPVFNLSKADALYGLGREKEAQTIYDRFPMEKAKRHGMLRYMKHLKPLNSSN